MDIQTLKNLSFKAIMNAVVATQESIIVKALAVHEYERKIKQNELEFEGVVSRLGFNDEDIEKMEKIGQERGIEGNYNQNKALVNKYKECLPSITAKYICIKNQREQQIGLEGFIEQLPFLKGLKVEKIKSLFK